jgi:hypothetical protein
MQKIGTFFQTLEKYECAADRDRPGGALSAPSLSLRDFCYFAKGVRQVPTLRVYQEMLSTKLASLGTGFQIPLFLFEGALDKRTSIKLAQRYFEQIHAPQRNSWSLRTTATSLR